MSYREAASLQELSVSVVWKHFNGKNNTVTRGKPPTLSAETESILADFLMYLTDVGFGLDKAECLDLVENYLHTSNQTHLFTNGRPSDEWFQAFMKRNPVLSMRVSNNMQSLRAQAMQPAVFENFFEQLKKVYDDNDFHHKCFTCLIVPRLAANALVAKQK